MKILTIISLVLSLNANIYMPLYKNAQNQTGNTDYAYFAQASYNYTNENPINIFGTQFMPIIYRLNIVINFKESVDHAVIHMLLTQPQTSSYDLNYITEFCTINYAGNYEFEITANNTNVCYITLLFSYDMVKDMYGYDWLEDNTFTPEQDEWVQNGDSYVNITTLQLKSVILSESPNYNTQLNSLIANTDTIESLLQSIVSNTSSISTINSNISSIKTTLTNLYNITNYSFNADKWYASLMETQSHIIDDINAVLSNNHFTLYPTDFIGGTGPGNPAQYVTIYDEDNDINTQYNKNKLKVIVMLLNDSGNSFYYVNVPVYENASSTETSFSESVCVYNRNNSRIEWVKFVFKITDKKISLWIDCFYNSLSNPINTTSSTIGSMLKMVYITDQPISTNQKINDILNVLSSINDDLVNDPNEDTLSDFYESLKQNLHLPTVPANDPNILKKMKKITDPVIRMFNLGELDIFKYMFNFGVLAMLFGVIFL